MSDLKKMKKADLVSLALDLKEELEKEQSRVEEVVPVEYCDLQCSDDARNHIKKNRGYRPMFVPKGVPYGFGGPELTFCPFCGRRYEDA